MTNKPKAKVSNIMIVITCIMIVLYTAANFLLQYFTQIEVSPTLTTAWFAFWGSEAGFLACIKISKVINEAKANVTQNDTIEQ
jgi:hypothetical protein